jgi:hypothetical protein
MIQLIEEAETWEADVLPQHQAEPERPCTNNRMLLHCGGQVIDRSTLTGSSMGRCPWPSKPE